MRRDGATVIGHIRILGIGLEVASLQWRLMRGNIIKMK